MKTRRKKLIEVALPLEAINKESAREKSIRHGHPSTLHLWWARRPLAACRAVLFAQMVDDPDYDPAFRNLDGTVDYDRAGVKRAELFNLIEEMVKWENINNQTILNRARAEIARCVASRKIEVGELEKDTIIHGDREGEKHPNGAVSGIGITTWEVVIMTASAEVVNHFLAEYAPPVLDPFAGGGSIPLEAQRLGLKAYASDLNPVAVLINKALIEIPPKFASMPPVNPEYQSKTKEEKALTQWQGAQGLAEDVRYYGRWMRKEAEKRIGHLYPKVKVTEDMTKNRPDLEPYIGQELTVMAWLWARTVPSPNPTLGGKHVPLVSTFWLSKRKGKDAYLKPIVSGEEYSFEVRIDLPDSQTKNKLNSGTKVGRGGNFKCIFSEGPIPVSYIREQGKAGNMGKHLLAIVCEGDRGRLYLPANAVQITAAESASLPDDIPNVPIAINPRDIRCQLYGLYNFSDLFTSRQLTALCTFSDLVREARQKIITDSNNIIIELERLGQTSETYSDAVATYLGITVGRQANRNCTISFWDQARENIQQVFARQALPMTWDYCESNPFSSSSGNWIGQLDYPAKCIERVPAVNQGIISQIDATSSSSYNGEIISTDPPYYDNIGYADLSDFFYVWLRRSLKEVYPLLFSTLLAPKNQELIANPYRHGGDKQRAARFFEEGLSKAIHLWREKAQHNFPTTIFYAFKQAESDDHGTASTGWETFLTGVIEAGFAITGTWPIRTEYTGNLKKNVAALASSVVLSCAPRSEGAPLATRRQFLQALKLELPGALKKLQSGSIAPVDLAQAAIGPGMGVFSRYSKVIEVDGEPMRVRTALALINQVLDEVLAEQEGEFDADTRWAIAWFDQHGMEQGPYGVAETLSKAKNTSVEGLVQAGILTARSGKVKLLSRDEMPEDWDPATDERLTGWESVQYLIRELDQDGEQAAAVLLKKLGSYSEIVRDLAYRLYGICERKKWATEAISYNSLVVAWPEISKLSQTVSTESTKQKDKSLFE